MRRAPGTCMSQTLRSLKHHDCIDGATRVLFRVLLPPTLTLALRFNLGFPDSSSSEACFSALLASIRCVQGIVGGGSWILTVRTLKLAYSRTASVRHHLPHPRAYERTQEISPADIPW